MSRYVDLSLVENSGCYRHGFESGCHSLTLHPRYLSRIFSFPIREARLKAESTGIKPTLGLRQSMIKDLTQLFGFKDRIFHENCQILEFVLANFQTRFAKIL